MVPSARRTENVRSTSTRTRTFRNRPSEPARAVPLGHGHRALPKLRCRRKGCRATSTPVSPAALMVSELALGLRGHNESFQVVVDRGERNGNVLQRMGDTLSRIILGVYVRYKRTHRALRS